MSANAMKDDAQRVVKALTGFEGPVWAVEYGREGYMRRFDSKEAAEYWSRLVTDASWTHSGRVVELMIRRGAAP